MSAKSLSATELDALFDSGGDIEPYIDQSTFRRPGLEKRRVNVDFTDWTVRRLDHEAKKRGVTRQALIKMWIADRLDQAA